MENTEHPCIQNNELHFQKSLLVCLLFADVMCVAIPTKCMFYISEYKEYILIVQQSEKTCYSSCHREG